MGGGTFDPGAYSAFASTTKGKTTDEIYRSRSMHASLDPKGVAMRESRDSVDNPQSTPVIVGLDVTGSMGMIADVIAREGLGTLFTGILDRKPISNPHLMFMAIGDVTDDRAPLQVSQFEADKRIIEQLTNIYLEHGGGGNNYESYNLPWYFAAFHTVHDAMEKRGKRGYLFTLGDEETPPDLTRDQIERVLGNRPQQTWTTADLLAQARRKYDVYHIIVEEGYHCSYSASVKQRTIEGWQKLLGQHLIRLKDHTKLAETIVSAIEVAEGADASASAAMWGSGAASIVHDAVKSLPRGKKAVPMLGHGS